MSVVSRLIRRVQWGDCDPAEIVYYPNYFRWFDEGSHNLLYVAGIPHHRIGEMFGILGTPLVDARASFKAPSRYHDEIEIESRITGWQRKTFTVSHLIRNGGRIAVEGVEIRVWAQVHPDDPARLMAVDIPDSFKDYFKEDGSR